jgi:hypothetical protein
MLRLQDVFSLDNEARLCTKQQLMLALPIEVLLQ